MHLRLSTVCLKTLLPLFAGVACLRGVACSAFAPVLIATVLRWYPGVI